MSRNSGLISAKHVSYFEYDFSRHGGAVGSITVPGDPIPAGAIIHNGVMHVTTALTSTGSATIAVQALSANDIKTATAVASWSANAILATVPVGTAGTSIRVTSNITSLTFVVAVEALATGKVTVAIEYYITA